MDTLLNFVYGPFLYISFGIFFLGCLYQYIMFAVSVYQKENQAISYMSLKYGLRSVLVWLVPFATVNMRKHPLFTAVTFLFHACLILSPIFLISHVMLIDESFNIGWWTLPDGLADAMTFAVVGSCIFFAIRRITSPVVKYVTNKGDYFILLIVFLPFVTGVLAYHQIFNYKVIMLLHILSGEIMLIAIPFTKLNHMLFAPFTRAYIGSEFGGVRHAKDW